MTIKHCIVQIVENIPLIGDYVKCVRANTYGISFLGFLKVKLRLGNSHYYNYPPHCFVQHPRKIYVGKCSFPFRLGGYIQAEGGVYIGSYVNITNYCTLMSTNHDLYDHNVKHPKPIIIHDYCWVGTHSIILAGVELGPRTIVGAGSVVTKSFPDGYCVIAGNPAKIVKLLDKNKVIFYHNNVETYGCLTEKQFKKFRKKYIDVTREDFGVESELTDFL